MRHPVGFLVVYMSINRSSNNTTQQEPPIVLDTCCRPKIEHHTCSEAGEFWPNLKIILPSNTWPIEIPVLSQHSYPLHPNLNEHLQFRPQPSIIIKETLVKGERIVRFVLSSYATQVWSSLGLPSPTSLDDLQQHPTIPGLNPNIWPSVALTVAWKIWDSRNALVFRNEDHTHRTTIRNIVADFSLWVFRFKKKEDNTSAKQWLNFLSAAIR